MNTNSMNTIAIGFAAFAAWYALSPKASTTAKSTAQSVWDMATAQRKEVGAATGANGAYAGQLANGMGYADNFTAAYAQRQGVPDSGIDILGHNAAYYSFSPSYALNS
jgi:hypothetical protein